jgi:membrane protease YdiL (CAAX protease family)
VALEAIPLSLPVVAVPVLLLGRRRLRRLLVHSARLPAPKWLAALALSLPPAGAIGTEPLPNLRAADAATLVASTSVAGVNAFAEELLWRGLFVETFPDDAIRDGCGRRAGSRSGT